MVPAVIGYIELLLEEMEEPEGTDCVPDLERVHKIAHQMLLLINDFLDISKIEAGQMQLNPELFEVEPFIQDITTTMQPLAGKNSNKIQFLSGDIDHIHGDRGRIQQILYNIISNACKFTKNGLINISVTDDRRQRGYEKRLLITVKDSGIGMTPEQIKNLFQPYRQANSETSGKYGGTGLGLNISQQLCKLMGGEISVASKLGDGTRLYISIPIAA